MKRSHESLRCVTASLNGKRRRRNSQRTAPNPTWNRCGSLRPDAEAQVGSWVMAIKRDGFDHIESRRAAQVGNRERLGAIAQKKKRRGEPSTPGIVEETRFLGS